MGKSLIIQKRGKGSPAYKSPGHRFVSKAEYRRIEKTQRAEIVDFVDDPGKTNILALIKYDDKTESFIPATEGIAVGDFIFHGPETELRVGNILQLRNIPEGYPVFNIEVRPNDGGKLVRATGNCAYVVAKQLGSVTVKLPSRKIKMLNEACFATLGCAAGGGRKEKPLLRAGNAFYKHRVRNKWWPRVRGVKMNVCNHPFGGKQHHGAITMKGKGGAPGQHVGSFGSKRTGRRKR